MDYSIAGGISYSIYVYIYAAPCLKMHTPSQNVPYQNVKNGSLNSSVTLVTSRLISALGFLTVINILPINNSDIRNETKPLGISMIVRILNILFGLSHEFPSFMFRPFRKCVLQYRSRGFYTLSEDVCTQFAHIFHPFIYLIQRRPRNWGELKGGRRPSGQVPLGSLRV